MYDSEKETYCNDHNNTMETTALYLAISKGEPRIVQMNPNWEQTLSNTYWNTQKKAPLHLAIEKKNQDIVELLLGHPQINLNLPFIYEGGHNFLEKYYIKKSPICVAIEADDLNIFRLLINHPNVDPSFEIFEEEANEARASYVSKFRPIHLAAQKGNPQIVKLLLKRPEVDVNSLFESRKVDSLKTTALNIAIKNNNTEVVRILQLHPQIKTNIKHIHSKYKKYEIDIKEEMSALYIAVSNKNKEIVKLLLSKPETDVNEPFIFSKKVGFSIYRGIDFTEIKKTPLSLAVENDDAETVELLLMKENTNVNAFSEYKSEYSIKENNVENKNGTEKNLSPLFVAVQKNNQKIVENLLLKSQINLNSRSLIRKNNDISEKTAIDLANENGNQIILNLFKIYH